MLPEEFILHNSAFLVTKTNATNRNLVTSIPDLIDFGYNLNLFEMGSESEMSSGLFVSVVGFIAELAMIFGGVVPYIPQYKQIYTSDDAEGFSLFVCLALLAANILRIIFWFGKPFETPLLLQSILMSGAMFMMIHLCVRVKERTEIIKKTDRKLRDSSGEGTIPPRYFTDFKLQHFWDWTDFASYLQCVFVFTSVCSLIMFYFLDYPLVVEGIGFLAVFVEAMLGVPQFLRNYRNGSTKGMNQTMVLMWTCGDIFKTVYFVTRAAPIQFTICGCLQIGVDLAILTQVWMYKSGGTPPGAGPSRST